MTRTTPIKVVAVRGCERGLRRKEGRERTGRCIAELVG
jgi:hypothetical protein